MHLGNMLGVLSAVVWWVPTTPASFCDMLLQDNGGETAAIGAARYGREATLKILVNAKADLEVKVRREGGEMLGEDGGRGGRWGMQVLEILLLWFGR